MGDSIQKSREKVLYMRIKSKNKMKISLFDLRRKRFIFHKRNKKKIQL